MVAGPRRGNRTASPEIQRPARVAESVVFGNFVRDGKREPGARMSRWRVVSVLAGVALAIGLPLAGWLVRQGGPPRCAYDGQRIEPRYRVRIVDRNNHGHVFCCVRCATRWVE